jgi:deoxyribodipyrimidine photo-lyase
MTAAPALLWFRHDLRLRDNPALSAALTAGRPVVPVFIWSPEEEGEWAPGGAARWWLHHSLAALDESLRRHGARLIVRRGPVLATLRALVRETGAGAVFWNRRYEPAAIAHDSATKQALLDDGLDVKSFSAALLHEPTRVQNQAGRPFQVFTPFWKHCSALPVREEVAFTWSTLPAPARWPGGESLDALGLRPVIPWDREFGGAWQPGEAGAQAALAKFLREAVSDYATERDRPDQPGTSRLSPHLRSGEVSPVQVWHAVRRASRGRGAEVFLSEIGWREFAYHLLFHFPDTTTEPLRPEFARFPWQEDATLLRAWQRGRTGFPIVDAGMRQLWRTGWMHNRVRMIAASLLVKHLLQPWSAGARWFWDTLVDADLASNTLGWQWSAGCGADAAPYFRVFNPLLQGAKFDPVGDYVRAFVPELARLPAQHIHAPWEAPADILAAAGVRLGENYPRPVIAHQAGRERALAAYAALREGR